MSSRYSAVIALVSVERADVNRVEDNKRTVPLDFGFGCDHHESEFSVCGVISTPPPDSEAILVWFPLDPVSQDTGRSMTFIVRYPPLNGLGQDIDQNTVNRREAHRQRILERGLPFTRALFLVAIPIYKLSTTYHEETTRTESYDHYALDACISTRIVDLTGRSKGSHYQ